MDSALARAPGFRMRRAIYFVCSAASGHVGCRSCCFFRRSLAARLGFGSHQKKRRPRRLRSLRVHAQSPLSWQLYPGPRIHHWLGQVVARDRLCGAVPWHLFAGNARRIRYAGQAFWGEFSSVRGSCAALFAALNPLSWRRDEDRIRSQPLHEISRV